VGAIIQSMTAEERAKPNVINGQRRERIAKGSGVTVFDVNQLLKQFAEMKKLMKQFSRPGKGGKRKRFGLPGGMPGRGGGFPGGFPGGGFR
jgi:signal recognition particle subunit SRP54